MEVYEGVDRATIEVDVNAFVKKLKGDNVLE